MTAVMIITGVLATIFMVIATMVLMAVVALTDIDDRRKEIQERIRNEIFITGRNQRVLAKREKSD